MSLFSKLKLAFGPAAPRPAKPSARKPRSPHKKLRVADNVDLVLGKHCGFNGMLIQNDGAAKCVARATVRIGNHFHSGRGCVIRTSDHDFTRGYPIVHGHVAGYQTADVTIGEYVWLGNDVLIMKGVTIGDGAIIQARSVVVGDIPPLAIAGGHPCRVFKYRDREEFEFLKNLNLSRVTPEEAEQKRALLDRELAAFRASRSRQPAPPSQSSAHSDA